MTKGTESKLRRLGFPAGAAAGCTVLVSLICQMLHV